jgi:hypothetical protein
MKSTVRAILFASTLLMSCVIGDDKPTTSSVDQHVGYDQGQSAQGQSAQGQSAQSPSALLNGVEFVNMSSVRAANGAALSGVKVEHGQLLATGLAGDDLVDARMTGVRGNGATVQLQIDDHRLDVGTNLISSDYPGHRSNTDVHLYKISFQATDGSWQPLCNRKTYVDRSGVTYDTYDSGMAVLLPGYWEIATGDYVAATTTKFAIGCWQGTIAKCVRWGYKPWKSITPLAGGAAISLKNLHLACVRGAMADYCGDGSSFTVNGTMVDVFDRYGFIKKEAEWNAFPRMFSEESSFDVTGAGCVEKARWHDIEADCPTEYVWVEPDYDDPGGHYKPIKRVIPKFSSGQREACMGTNQLVIFDTSTYCKDPFTATVAMPADCSACTTDICAAHPECCADFYDSDVDGDPKGTWSAACRTAASSTLTCGPPLTIPVFPL